MINEYTIIDYSKLGIPSVTAEGDSFNYYDLFEMVGRHKYMTTFSFINDSESYQKYGDSITGTIYYNQKTNEELLNGHSLQNEEVEKIFVVSALENLPLEKIEHLKYEYGGVIVSDIKSISFLPYCPEMEFYKSGEKKVPNIIEIEVDCAEIDPDTLCQGYLIKKNNDGVKLIEFEKEQLIGITFAINNGHIDSRILKHLGYNKEDITKNMNIWYHLYKVKERRGNLSEEEKEKYSEIKQIQSMERILNVMKEINSSNVTPQEFSENNALKTIMDTIEPFTPSILLHGKNQIYWNFESYIHILMRHFVKYQMGDFKSKTPLNYMEGDLKPLIEKILGCISNEYQSHAEKKPDTIFSRQGRRAILFNGDYYSIRVLPDGRLTQFHSLGETLS